MNRTDFNQVVNNRLNLIEKVLANKGKEYAGDENVFHNFESAIGISFAECREKVAWEFMTKHLQSIKDLIEGACSNGPTQYPAVPIIEEKIGDAINYLILIEGMLKERVKKRDQL